MDDSRINFAQLVGSLLVAAAIVAAVIVAVTAQLGPTSAAELDAREEVLRRFSMKSGCARIAARNAPSPRRSLPARAWPARSPSRSSTSTTRPRLSGRARPGVDRTWSLPTDRGVLARGT